VMPFGDLFHAEPLMNIIPLSRNREERVSPKKEHHTYLLVYFYMAGY